MTFHGESFGAVGLEASRHVVISYAVRVKPVFESGAPTAVSEQPSIPHALQRRHLVVARASTGLHRKVGIRPYGERQNVEVRARVGRHAEALRRCELVARVEGRRVAHDAALIRKDLLAAGGERVELIGIGRRLQRIDIRRQGIELFVAVAASDGDGIGGFGPRGGVENIGRNESIVARKVVRALVERGVAHEVSDGPLLLETRVIQIVPVFYADQIRHLDGIKQIGSMASDNACGHRLMSGNKLVIC